MKRALLCVLLAASFAATPLFAERILLPIYSEPVFGAGGSQFITQVRIFNSGTAPVPIAGIYPYCNVCLSPPLNYVLAPGEEFVPTPLTLPGTPGRFFRIDDQQLDDVAINVRVLDTSREELNFGTEMPVVRESDFRINRVVLIGVPTDARFRNTLRIYSIAPVPVLVKVGNAEPVRLELRSGDDGLFDPAYAIYSSFPTGDAPIHVEVIADPDFVSLLPIETPIWAFISVTNNETHAITTITPQ